MSYITVAVTEDTSDLNNIVTNLTVTWSDSEDCSANYNAYLNIYPGTQPGHETPGSQLHLGSVASGSIQIAKELTGVQGTFNGFDVEVFCGTDGSGRLVSRVDVPWYDGRPSPGTYSSEPPLSALSVSHGTLTPAFKSSTFDYTVPDVANADTRITIAATSKEGYAVNLFETSGGAVLAVVVNTPWYPIPGLSAGCRRGYADSNGPLIELTDADPNTPGFQVDLYDGENHVFLDVYPTAYCDDGTGYDLAITRAEGNVSLVRPNRPAVGLPDIAHNGRPCVGCTVDADVSLTRDRDGMDNATFSYQWLVDDADITGATGSSYRVTFAELGKTLKVRVSFTDDRGNEESLTSVATQEVRLPNSAPSGKPVILGTLEVGQTLTADVSGIRDANGLTNATFRYWWSGFSGPNGEEHTLVDRDEGPCDCWLTVTYTDDDGYHEQVESERIGVVAPRANSPAISAPVITGTAQVGETLTADTTGIADADGLSGTTFTYQWVANDGTADTDIAGATESTYTLVADDEGKTIKVRVSFTDDAGNDETLTSTATDTVSYAIQQQTSDSPATGAPVITGTAQVGETLTADTSGIADNDGLNSVSYSYQWIRIDGLSDTDIAGGTDSNYTLVADDQGKTIKMRVSFTDDAGNHESLTSAATATVAARANTPATGAPAITGTVQVGETLTADTSGIADDDGLTNVSFSYQWIRNDGSTDTDITSATDLTYTLVADDEGKTIKVRVSFTDDAGKAESLTSAATAMVKVRQWKMSASWSCGIVDWTNLDVRGCDIRDQVVFGFRLREAVNDDDPSTVDYVLRMDMLHDNGTDANECEGTNMGTDIEVTTVDDEVVIGSGSLGHADCEPGVYKLRLSAREGASATWYSTDSHDIWLRWPNEAAMGRPTIAGTAQVGETLTADSSSIVDDNGLSRVTFSYQWIANDGTSDADIAGGTDSTYTLVADDEGNTIKVRVSFTDDDEYTELLTSDATEAVSFAIQQQVANTPATGVPAITGTSQMGEMLTADTSGIADDDGLESVSFSYQWVRNDGSSDTDITTATDSTYTLVAADEGKTIKVRVSFTDDRGNPESLTSAATNAVEAAPEPPAKPTGLSATVVSHDAATLAWDDPQDDAITGYVILRRDKEIHPVRTFVTIAGDTGSADTTYTDDTVEPDKQYNYKIEAINEHGEVSERSHWVGADTPAVPVPDKPTGLSAAVSHDAVTLTWDDPQDDSITGYVILRRDRAIHPTGTFVTIAGDTGSADTTYTDDTVEPDKEYVYRIKAINEHGEMSERSHWVRGFTPAAPAPAGSPAK